MWNDKSPPKLSSSSFFNGFVAFTFFIVVTTDQSKQASGDILLVSGKLWGIVWTINQSNSQENDQQINQQFIIIRLID